MYKKPISDVKHEILTRSLYIINKEVNLLKEFTELVEDFGTKLSECMNIFNN